LHASERGFAIHATGLTLRRALLHRLVSRDAYRQVIEADVRPTSYVFAGLGLRYPLASTRADLDLIARAGARLWQVLEISPADVVVAAVPVESSAEYSALSLAAQAAGVPALFPGDNPAEVDRTLRLVAATVLAAPADSAAILLDELAAAGTPLAGVRLLILVGAPSPEERQAAEQTLADAGSRGSVAAVHAPSGARVLWGECPGSGEMHTYPDLEVVEVVDPETAGPYSGGGPGEVVLTQLGFRGSALLRWRTADVVSGPVLVGACSRCGRTVPRLSGIVRGGLVVRPVPEAPPVDLRGLTAALSGRADLIDWRVVVGPRERDGQGQLVVHVATDGRTDPADVAVAAAAEIRQAAGALPTQIVASEADEFEPPAGRPLTRRVLLRS
jgi:hypothetical protein